MMIKMIQMNYQMKFLVGKSIIFNILLSFSVLGFAQFKIPAKPSLQTSVYDYANILEDSQEEQLRKKLVRYSDSTSTQIVIITIEDLKGEYIGELAPRWGQEWGIGQKDKDNGIVMLMSVNDRKFWIAPGYEAEIKLTAGITGTIYRNVIKPYFKSGDYYGGLDAGTDAVFQVLKGTFKNDNPSSNKSKPFGPILILIFIIVLFVILSKSNKGNNGGGNNSGGGGFDLTDFIILSSLGRSGRGSSDGGSWGGGSGGFGGGFGGGGFSGGGAGGDW